MRTEERLRKFDRVYVSWLVGLGILDLPLKPSRGDLKWTHRDQWNSYPGAVDRTCGLAACQVTEYNQYHYNCLSSGY